MNYEKMPPSTRNAHKNKKADELKDVIRRVCREGYHRYLFELINLGPMEGDRNQMRTFMTIRSVASVSDDKANNTEETVKLLLEFL